MEETEGMSTLAEEHGGKLWTHLTDCILDVLTTNHDAFIGNLRSHEREKKKYLQAYLDQSRHFSPFVVACDGCLEM